MKTPTAAILVIGDEILSGKTEDRNARLLISELRELGVALKRIVIIPDDIETVSQTVKELSDTFDYVFTSGGVGPTHDDVTIPGIARAFNQPIVSHPILEAKLKSYFGENVDETRLRLSLVPKGSELVDATDLKWPVLAYRNVYILPGVPEHFSKKFKAIREKFRVAPFYNHAIYTLEDEFDIAESLRKVADAHPNVAIGSYPSYGSSEYKVKLTLESKNKSELDIAVMELSDKLDVSKLVKF